MLKDCDYSLGVRLRLGRSQHLVNFNSVKPCDYLKYGAINKKEPLENSYFFALRPLIT